jgi:hypothetical protein
MGVQERGIGELVSRRAAVMLSSGMGRARYRSVGRGISEQIGSWTSGVCATISWQSAGGTSVVWAELHDRAWSYELAQSALRKSLPSNGWKNE